jgi:putative protease
LSRELNRLPELLAPAGSWEALVAAVSAGADAVYLGGKRYGARAYAENFEEAQLIRALEYAHRSDVKVYVTVNTLLTERELPHAAQFLLFLYEQGADGVLVQDAGLIRLARHTVPHLPLHASTQMTIHSSAGVQWAQEMGLRRVVLARELTLQEISLMAGRLSGSGIGLEVFIHGALCYSYSGQCLLSSSIGGRSGNRGRCAQPCRKPFHLVHGSRDGYDRVFVSPPDYPPSYCLSTRDLCTYQRLDELVRLSVESLKIEGRMKSPEYVATVVRL